MMQQETSSLQISALSFFLFLIMWPAGKRTTKRNQRVKFSYVDKVFFGIWLSTQHQDFFLVKWIMFSCVSHPSLDLTSLNTINVFNITGLGTRDDAGYSTLMLPCGSTPLDIDSFSFEQAATPIIKTRRQRAHQSAEWWENNPYELFATDWTSLSDGILYLKSSTIDEDKLKEKGWVISLLP